MKHQHGIGARVALAAQLALLAACGGTSSGGSPGAGSTSGAGAGGSGLTSSGGASGAAGAAGNPNAGTTGSGGQGGQTAGGGHTGTGGVGSTNGTGGATGTGGTGATNPDCGGPLPGATLSDSDLTVGGTDYKTACPAGSNTISFATGDGTTYTNLTPTLARLITSDGQAIVEIIDVIASNVIDGIIAGSPGAPGVPLPDGVYTTNTGSCTTGLNVDAPTSTGEVYGQFQKTSTGVTTDASGNIVTGQVQVLWTDRAGNAGCASFSK